MLNGSLKKEAVEKLKKEVSNYENAQKNVQKAAVNLHNSRTSALEVIHNVERYINSIANTPKEFDKEFDAIRINTASFKALSEITYDEKLMIKIAGGGSVAGVAAGVATAAFAPTAAMAIATTFGTASTGAAISGLTGAAATNAALAWLGGGALAAGGGGMATGNALLALAGPIGWSIGAASLLAGGVYASKKNKEAAIKADKERLEIAKERSKIDAIQYEIVELTSTTKKLMNELYKMITNFTNASQNITSFEQYSSDQRQELIAIINNTSSLSKLFMKEIGK
ncbi:hypothetical protein [Psychrobacillus lasiicapitis]|uniref:Uncharacterized protein n=1 Tax=Psychrobacillus lasiicapitis TaxID=1636719 RepID=A0A544SZT9_9BACI|nr:hypothetical protein [Psychrobacillus lasiicapitis]TQR10721.1 hypothetical protein FG382_16790 [Psychrobacillus lasiicapitis]GGA43071.1 hypothetical protein GCM10011384_36050 [Psychrobacillus lasiicapitis]